MDADDEAREPKLAANQSRFRRSKERLQRAASAHRSRAGDRLPFLCECADPCCFEAVMLSLDEYERVHDRPSRFVLVAGHEDAEAEHERIVEAESGYAIVEKLGNSGAEAARPRARPHLLKGA
jgi:hypothetical protein